MSHNLQDFWNFKDWFTFTALKTHTNYTELSKTGNERTSIM